MLYILFFESCEIRVIICGGCLWLEWLRLLLGILSFNINFSVKKFVL